jgi:hypothetical protein
MDVKLDTATIDGIPLLYRQFGRGVIGIVWTGWHFSVDTHYEPTPHGSTRIENAITELLAQLEEEELKLYEPEVQWVIRKLYRDKLASTIKTIRMHRRATLHERLLVEVVERVR